MAIQQKLHARLVQKLILTPSLQQAIKLLPMSTLELAELLNQEMVENPLLEETPAEDPTAEQAATPETTPSWGKRTEPPTMNMAPDVRTFPMGAVIGGLSMAAVAIAVVIAMLFIGDTPIKVQALEPPLELLVGQISPLPGR